MSASIPTPPTEETKASPAAQGSGGAPVDPEQVREQLDALSEIYRTSYRDFHRQALAMVRSPELADDVVQEAVVFTAQTIQKGTVIRKPKPWLRVVVRNCARSALSRRRVRLATSAPLDEGLEIASAQGVGDILDVKDRLEEVNHVVRALPSAQRSAFLLAELRGFEYHEIARALDRTEEAVRQLLCRARGKVRALAESGQDLAPFAVPLNLSAAGCTSWRDVGRGLRHHVVGRLSDLQQSVGSLFHQSAELVGQPATALVVGTLVIGSVGGLSGDPRADDPHGAVALPGMSIIQQGPAGEPVTEPETSDKRRQGGASPRGTLKPSPSAVTARPAPGPARPVGEIGGGERLRPPTEAQDARIKAPKDSGGASVSDPATVQPPPTPPQETFMQWREDAPPPPPPPDEERGDGCDPLSLSTTCDSSPPPGCGEGGDQAGGRVMMAHDDGCDDPPPPPPPGDAM